MRGRPGGSPRTLYGIPGFGEGGEPSRLTDLVVLAGAVMVGSQWDDP